jgi:hypothetical protein
MFSPNVTKSKPSFRPSVESLEQRNMLDANANFVKALYTDLLGRQSGAETDQEVAFWTGLLAGGTTRQSVVAQMQTTAEYQDNVVDALFVKYLGRDVQAGSELGFYTGLLQQGHSLTEVKGIILGSNEYYNDQGGTDGAYVDAVYNDVLGRFADDNGAQYWLNILGSLQNGHVPPGLARKSVGTAIAASPEGNSFYVNSEFGNLLGRPVDAAGDQYFNYGLNKGFIGQKDVVTQIAASDEYFASAQQSQ